MMTWSLSYVECRWYIFDSKSGTIQHIQYIGESVMMATLVVHVRCELTVEISFV